ncbi:MAG: hypothetical protein HZA92_06480 [Verrucomicrobia bacterium]|nr:hypothetical protein [Verrucomicrobiota bacterium]
MQSLGLPGLLLASHLLAGTAGAQSTFLEMRETATLYNYGSVRGVPISSVANSPAGSDGRAPTQGYQQSIGETTQAANSNQFRSFVSFGAVAAPRTPANLAPGTSLAANAANLGLPTGTNGSGAVVVIMLAGRLGGAYAPAVYNFKFGATIPVPDAAIDGSPLGPTAALNYWVAEPFTTNNHAGSGYHYSPNAGKVFATQSGQVRVIWRRADPLPGQPGDYVGNQNVKYALVEGFYYDLQPKTYVVAGSAVQPTRLMGWTEGSFSTVGKRVTVPAAIVKDIKFAYNSAIPQYVPTNEVYQASSATSALGAQGVIQETRTFWNENGFLSAYNKEGRIFMELLGDTSGGNLRRHLGIEIIDLTRELPLKDVMVEIGELMPPAQVAVAEDAGLRPEALNTVGGLKFAHEHYAGGAQNISENAQKEYYALRETPQANSSQLRWVEQGVAGLFWPVRMVRYQQVWPTSVDKYSHYVRSVVPTPVEAMQTAVPLSVQNTPSIEYEDPTARLRSFLTQDSKFYTFLDTGVPALRTLLRFNSNGKIRFERVFSWLDVNLRTTNFANTAATNLAAWDANNQILAWPDELKAPRVVNQNAWVGQRIDPPAGETNAFTGLSYLAGYILQAEGTGFSVTAYQDPYVVGFSESVASSIIPVNARNNDAKLEVWWFRPNSVNNSLGFQNVLWPSTVGRYSILWPTNEPFARDLILASNDGSGGLGSLEAKGGLYIQNDPAQPGYNPNEEHALMQGGQAWALRDDLNITSGASYSSHPYVLLQYTATDGRPSMTVFQVLREKGNIKFDYTMNAGIVLQAPMPLPLMDKPLGSKVVGEPPRSLNIEIRERNVTATTLFSGAGGFYGVSFATADRPFFQACETLALQSVPTNSGPIQSRWFYSTATEPYDNRIHGVVTTVAPLTLGVWTGSAQPVDTTKYRFQVNSLAGLTTGLKCVVGNAAQQTNWGVTISGSGTISGSSFVELQFASTTPAAAQTDTVLAVPDSSVTVGMFVGWRLGYEKVPDTISDVAIRDRYASFTFQDRKGDTWLYRGPHETDGTAKMVMQFYYKTLEGFYYPIRAHNAQPPVGTITPYLRPLNPDGSYAGDPISGDVNRDNIGDGNPLGIIYRAVWPDSTPVLMMAETLATPKRGLPAMRGQTSLQLLYQQSHVAGGLTAKTVVLHDPTRQKQSLLAPPDDTANLTKIPDSVRTSRYNGKTYFPNLPPHLVERVFFDPARGANGALVLAGQFKQEIVGDSFFLLNVLGPQDAAALKGLCVVGDPMQARWNAVIDAGLQTAVEQFVENSARPGTFIPGATNTYGPGVLAEVKDQDEAVDSYALTAVGPKVGYISVIAANGSAFTTVGDPVSVYVIKVVDTLYRGELKIVQSSNPLNEMLTLQQVVDLAGKLDDYEFEWKISAPVDGSPPPVYLNTRSLLLGDGTWSHVRFPLATDQPATVAFAAPSRVIPEITTAVTPVSMLPFANVAEADGGLSFVLQPGAQQFVAVGNKLVVRNDAGTNIFATAKTVSTTTYLGQPATNVVVSLDPGQATVPTAATVIQLFERAIEGAPASVAFRRFTLDESKSYSQFYLSLDLGTSLGAKVYLDGVQVAVAGIGNADTATVTAPGAFSPLSRVYRLGPDLFAGGQRSGGIATHTLAIEFYSTALPGAQITFNARLEAYESVDQTAAPGSPWLALDSSRYVDKVRAILGGSADVRSLGDNYLIARYRATNPSHASFNRGFSQWTEPQLAEGWIKRVLAGINPFNQRVTDLFNNAANTDASILTQAGKRWEGDVALNLENINSAGLIEIYETVLRRGKMLSLEAGINYGPANDALLLAAGYLNDLYMMLGNEAYADAANPTIGIGTADKNYGDIATALFAFRGQMSSLLEEELALMRGRDDFIQPGVTTQPIYNRLFWNYTRGIDAGEVIYALNYNIQPQGGTNASIGAADAAHMFPQGHGDGYGHYLTAVKNYYQLLLDPSFDWVPKSEAVTVLGKAVQVNYQNERKFAAGAAALARSGSQIVDLTWRRDYTPGDDIGWESLGETRDNLARSVPTTRHWSVDHWATRTAMGAYFNWTVGNAILPATDPDPSHEGIQKVDRTTVPELAELPATALQVQLSMDNAEGHFTPLGLPGASLAFDINPNQINGPDPKPHFEQIYERAKGALNNAIVSFDDAKDVTRLLRSETDSLTLDQAAVAKQELAYQFQLIELYGTPYSDDIGPGKTWKQGYTGPDLVHYAYVDVPELPFPSLWNYAAATDTDWKIDIQNFPSDWGVNYGISDLNVLDANFRPYSEGTTTNRFISFHLGPHGFDKPSDWVGKRVSPGRIQQSLSKIIAANAKLRQAVYDNAGGVQDLGRAIALFKLRLATHYEIRQHKKGILEAQQALETAKFSQDVASKILALADEHSDKITSAIGLAFPKVIVAGVAAGTDAPGNAAQGTIKTIVETTIAIAKVLNSGAEIAVQALEFATAAQTQLTEFEKIAPLEWDQEVRSEVANLASQLGALQSTLYKINGAIRERDDALREYSSLVAQGDRIQEERLVFRQRAAAITQGYRTRDAAFRIFRNEKLERYKTLFDLSARYTFMAAQAYDYETGLLNTAKGKQFISRIVNSRALGVVKAGEPQYAGSNTGDPGLSSVLAEMKADWNVLKGRLGFNNPTAYGTTVSLRMENHRLVPGSEGDNSWKDILNQARRTDLLADEDVRRQCLQIAPGDSLTVPGLVIEFSTTITPGRNFFGRELAGGDSYFPPSYFATKIFSIGVALEGYKGMANPAANTGVVGSSGGTSPADPSASFLDPQALAATPGIYLIPVGVDSMRSPPLGDVSAIRTWAVNDVTIPLPFNIGASAFSTKALYQSADSLTEPLFNLRKHPEFRPVSTTSAFSRSIYGGGGTLQQSEYTNTRLVGRSVWNSKWKLVIPGYKLLNDPNDGLDRFISTVKDIKIYLVTYSYAGN